MKRRHALKTLSMSCAGIAGIPLLGAASAERPLGLEYLSKVRDLLARIKSTQSDELLEASYRIAATIRKGGTCYMDWDLGHSNLYDIWNDRPGNTDILRYGIPEKVKKGDLILTNSYSPNLEKHFESARKGDIFLIAAGRPWGGDCLLSELLVPRFRDMKIKPYAHLWIELFSTAYGGIITVPGETAPMGPVSGVVGMMTYWMMVADAARLLAADGVQFTVYGEEKRSVKGDENVDMNRPLGEVYYETALGQQQEIGSQFAAVENMAAMAVHSALTGGRVYVYSRYGDNLCAEGTVRRGGLGLTFGVYGAPGELVLMDDPLQRGIADLSFAPTDKDVVIMGIARPDDPDDLASLDAFKKSGAGLAAIGPSTRNGEVPKGRTLPSEVDVYCGDMTDSYGVFALPGVPKKICPTSGLVNNQIFWAVCCQIADLIVRRTGSAPGIYLSGALKGGMEKLNEVKRLYKERGY